MLALSSTLGQPGGALGGGGWGGAGAPASPRAAGRPCARGGPWFIPAFIGCAVRRLGRAGCQAHGELHLVPRRIHAGASRLAARPAWRAHERARLRGQCARPVSDTHLTRPTTLPPIQPWVRLRLEIVAVRVDRFDSTNLMIRSFITISISPEDGCHCPALVSAHRPTWNTAQRCHLT